jgi:MFS family permease
VGLGLGGLAGGLTVTVARPQTFTTLFLANAGTFLVYGLVLMIGVHAPPRERAAGVPRRGYRDVAHDGVFIRFAALNFLFVVAVVSLLNSVFPVFARNQAGLSETSIGALFLVNSVTIIVFQLPTARAIEGRRRMHCFALMGVIFALCWSLVQAGVLLSPALLLVGAGIVAMSLGECIYDSIQGPLVAELAPEDLLSRYMAVSGFSWQLGFIAGPALAGLVLGAEPNALWPLMTALCLAGSAYALFLDRRLPETVRFTTRDAARRAARRAVPRVAAALRRR